MRKPPPIGPNKGTRPKGSGIPARGAGLHGAASGVPAQAFSAEAQPEPEAKSAGKEVAREARERIAAKKNAILDRLIKNAIEGSESASNQAGIYLINQIAGAPVASVDLTSGGDKLPGYVVRAPAEIEDVAEWVKKNTPR